MYTNQNELLNINGGAISIGAGLLIAAGVVFNWSYRWIRSSIKCN